MAINLHLQNLSRMATNLDVRRFFVGLDIPEGGVQIVGGPNGDAFISFSNEQDLLQAILLDKQPLLGQQVKLYLATQQDMERVIRQRTIELEEVRKAKYAKEKIQVSPAKDFYMQYPKASSDLVPPHHEVREPVVQFDSSNLDLSNPFDKAFQKLLAGEPDYRSSNEYGSSTQHDHMRAGEFRSVHSENEYGTADDSIASTNTYTGYDSGSSAKRHHERGSERREKRHKSEEEETPFDISMPYYELVAERERIKKQHDMQKKMKRDHAAVSSPSKPNFPPWLKSQDEDSETPPWQRIIGKGEIDKRYSEVTDDDSKYLELKAKLEEKKRLDNLLGKSDKDFRSIHEKHKSQGKDDRHRDDHGSSSHGKKDTKHAKTKDKKHSREKDDKDSRHRGREDKRGSRDRRHSHASRSRSRTRSRSREKSSRRSKRSDSERNEEHVRRHSDDITPNPSRCVKMANVPVTVTARDIREFFTKCEILEGGILLKSGDTELSPLVAYLKFVHGRDARKACDMNGQTLHGRHVIIEVIPLQEFKENDTTRQPRSRSPEPRPHPWDNSVSSERRNSTGYPKTEGGPSQQAAYPLPPYLQQWPAAFPPPPFPSQGPPFYPRFQYPCGPAPGTPNPPGYQPYYPGPGPTPPMQRFPSSPGYLPQSGAPSANPPPGFVPIIHRERIPAKPPGKAGNAPNRHLTSVNLHTSASMMCTTVPSASDHVEKKNLPPAKTKENTNQADKGKLFLRFQDLPPKVSVKEMAALLRPTKVTVDNITLIRRRNGVVRVAYVAFSDHNEAHITYSQQQEMNRNVRICTAEDKAIDFESIPPGSEIVTGSETVRAITKTQPGKSSSHKSLSKKPGGKPELKKRSESSSDKKVKKDSKSVGSGHSTTKTQKRREPTAKVKGTAKGSEGSKVGNTNKKPPKSSSAVTTKNTSRNNDVNQDRAGNTSNKTKTSDTKPNTSGVAVTSTASVSEGVAKQSEPNGDGSGAVRSGHLVQAHNLPSDITEAEAVAYFSQACPPIANSAHKSWDLQGKPVISVRFNTVEEAELAVEELNDTEYRDCCIHVFIPK